MRNRIVRTALFTAFIGGSVHMPMVSADLVPYALDEQHTHIVWQVDRFGFTKTVGTFTTISGEVALDESNLENSHVRAEIALSGLRSDLAQREEIVRGPYWLDSEKHPTITFHSDSVKVASEKTCPKPCVVVQGKMSLKGVSAPLILNVTINKIGSDPVSKKRAVGFSATGSFARSAFGISTALGPVGDQVTFKIEALAIKAD